MTLARAAPISVPATPKNEATTAEETAASALAASSTGLSWVRVAPVEGPSGRSTDSVRGEFMSSEGSASGGRAAGKKEVPSDLSPRSRGYGEHDDAVGPRGHRAA